MGSQVDEWESISVIFISLPQTFFLRLKLIETIARAIMPSKRNLCLPSDEKIILRSPVAIYLTRNATSPRSLVYSAVSSTTTITARLFSGPGALLRRGNRHHETATAHWTAGFILALFGTNRRERKRNPPTAPSGTTSGCRRMVPCIHSRALRRRNTIIDQASC